MIRYAISRLGVDYDMRQIFDLARFLRPWSALPRRFRSTLFERNAGGSARTVCSTIIAEAFAFVQFPILPLVKQTGADTGERGNVQMFRRNPRLCTPSDFDYSPYFNVIKYPFVDFNYSSDCHLLPWTGTGELTDEENELYLSPREQPSAAAVDEAIVEAVKDTGLFADPPADPLATDEAAVDQEQPSAPERTDSGNSTIH